MVYAEEPSAGMVIDGGWLKDLCGGVEMSTSAKYGHQVRFETTFHPVLISNSVQPLDITPNDDTVRRKRVGFRMMNRFAPPGDAFIDGLTVFAAEAGVRELIAKQYWVPLLRLMHELYQRVLQPDGTARFDSSETAFAIDFPPPAEAVGIQHWVDMYEVFEPARGAQGIGMEAIYSELCAQRGLDQAMSQQLFYGSDFKARLMQKIEAFRAAAGQPSTSTGNGGARFKRLSSGGSKFFGVRLIAQS